MIRLTWPRINEASPLGFLLLTSFLVRLVLIPFFLDDFNAWSYGVFGSILIGGHDPYLVVSQDPTLLNINPWRYPPLYLLLTVPALLGKVVTGNGLVYLAILKIPLAICDTVSTLFLYRILETHSSRRIALRGSVLFAFNPAVVFNTAVAGFSDPVAIMFTVIAFYYFLSNRKNTDSSPTADLYKAGLFLGLGIVAKIYPMLILPVLLRESKDWRTRLLILVMSALPVLFFSLPFLVADPSSYLYMLTIKNAGGEHPLFGGIGFPTSAQLLILGFLSIPLIWIYVARMPLYPRLALTFLWINLATLSGAFQYLTWGIPFFVLLICSDNSVPKMLAIYPIIETLGALVFNGWYDIYTGASGPYYWMFHVLQQQIVVFRAYPILGEIAAFATPISILVTIYFIVRIGSADRFGKTWTRLPSIRLPKSFRLPTIGSPGRRLVLLLLLVLGMVSWGFVASHSTFQTFSSPTVQGNIFATSFHFDSSTLDYQLVFAGNASYSVTPGSGVVTLSSHQTNTSSFIYRGWLHVSDGFRQSDSALVSFRFKVDDFPTNASSMNIATLSGGNLFIERNGSGSNFEYFESALDTNRTISSADAEWHSFAANYTQQYTAVSLDTQVLLLAPSILTRVALGNQNDSLPFGRVEYSDFQATLRDFPGGESWPYSPALTLAAPLAATILTCGVLTCGSFRRLVTRKQTDTSAD